MQLPRQIMIVLNSKNVQQLRLSQCILIYLECALIKPFMITIPHYPIRSKCNLIRLDATNPEREHHSFALQKRMLIVATLPRDRLFRICIEEEKSLGIPRRTPTPILSQSKGILHTGSNKLEDSVSRKQNSFKP